MAALELVMTMDDDIEREVEKYRQSNGKDLALAASMPLIVQATALTLPSSTNMEIRESIF